MGKSKACYQESGCHLRENKKLFQRSQLCHQGEFWHISVMHDGYRGSVVRIFVGHFKLVGSYRPRRRLQYQKAVAESSSKSYRSLPP